MPKYRITGPDGQNYEVNAPEGATQDDVLAYAQRNFKMAKAPAAEAPSKPFGQQLNEGIADLPRQLGLTARAGLQGLGSVADLITAPVRAGLNSILQGSQDRANLIADKIAPEQRREAFQIPSGSGQALSDILGLPKPSNPAERVVGDAASMLAGGALPIAAGANLARNASGVAQGIGRLLASNPGKQLASAAAAGGAGSYTRETGGNDVSQLVASLAAGLAAPAAIGAAERLGGAAVRGASALTGRNAPQPVQVDVTINNALQDSGLSLNQLPADVARGIRADVAEAMKVSDNLSPDAVRRLADYRLTGLTPTRAKLTQDVGDITRQANLSKLGVNSSDPAAQQLAQTTNANNRALTSGLNNLGGSTVDDQIAGAQKVMGALSGLDERARQAIGARYETARAANGRAAQLDPSAFTQRANNLLDDALLGGKLPADVRNLLNKAANGEMPLTVDVAEQFKTRLGDLQRSTMDMAERKALGIVRSALDDTPLLSGQEIGQDAISAFNSARRLNRRYMTLVDKTPALQAVRDGVEPDKFVQQFIVGSGKNANVMDLAALKSTIKNSPEAMDAVREQIVAHLKSKALNGAADETGNFGQAAYNKALNAIGDRKLRLFFDQGDIDQLKALGRVAAYEQFQPVGSAVNNSNTAGAVGNILDRIGGSALLGKIPFGKAAIGEPLQNISIGLQASRALNAPQSLTLAPIRQSARPAMSPLLVSPAAFMTPEERERQRIANLFP